MLLYLIRVPDSFSKLESKQAPYYQPLSGLCLPCQTLVEQQKAVQPLVMHRVSFARLAVSMAGKRIAKRSINAQLVAHDHVFFHTSSERDTNKAASEGGAKSWAHLAVWVWSTVFESDIVVSFIMKGPLNFK